MRAAQRRTTDVASLRTGRRAEQVVSWAVGLAVVAALWLTWLHSYLLFHSLTELFSIVVACAIFVLFWNARRFLDNGALLVLGVAFLFVGLVDLLHTLSYEGMNVFSGSQSNLATQLWIVGRSLQGAAFLAAALCVRRAVNAAVVFLAFAAATGLLLAAIFYWHVFPACYVPGVGLTGFKVGAEYAICLVLVVSGVLFWRERSRFDPAVLRLLILSVAATVAAEIAFTFYSGVFDLANVVGHFLKLLAFFLIYKAMVEVGLRRPYDLVFRELKRSEEALRQSEERFRTLADFTYDWEDWVGPDGRYVYVSPSCERVTGHRADEFLEDPSFIFRISHPDDREAVVHHFRDARDDAGPLSLEFRILDRTGNQKWIEHLCQPVYGMSGNFLGRRGSNRDVTVRVQAEQAVREAQQRIAEQQRQARELAESELAKAKRQLVRQTRLAAIGQIAASIVHDVRNPLMSMRLLIDSLKETAGTESAAWGDFFGQMDAEIETTSRMISNLMELARSKQSIKQPVDLGLLVEAVARQLGLHDWIRWCVELDPCPLVVSADPVQLRQVLGNLAANAAHAMGGRGQIRVWGRRNGTCDEIIVEDDGPGVPPEIRDEIFEPLVTGKPKGTGLGLAICRQILQRHGGTIELCDTPRRGARFRICLPRSPDPAAQTNA